MQQIGSSSWTKASLAGLGLCAACGGDPVEAVSETDGTEASDGSTATDPEVGTSEPTSATTNEGMTSTSDTTAGTDPDDGTGSTTVGSTDDGTDKLGSIFFRHAESDGPKVMLTAHMDGIAR